MRGWKLTLPAFFLSVCPLLQAAADDGLAGLLAGADAEYGAYLAGECVTCHRPEGPGEGIPNIAGLEAETIASLLLAYKGGEIDHDAMRLIASRLDDEQIASLAVYFSSLPAPE